MTKPDLYLDLDGVLIDTTGKTRYPTVVPVFDDFINWAIERFNCFYLTAWPESHIHGGILKREMPKFPRIDWDQMGDKNEERNKVNGINLNNDFVWLDDDEITCEQKDLFKYGRINSFFHVNSEVQNDVLRFSKNYDINPEYFLLKRKMDFLTLEEHNMMKQKVYVIPNKSISNGISCPTCGHELYDSFKNESLLSYPPQKSIYCKCCGYTGSRIE